VYYTDTDTYYTNTYHRSHQQPPPTVLPQPPQPPPMAAETPRETLHHALQQLLAQHDGQAAIEEESALRAAVTAALGLDVEQRPAPAPEPEVPAVPQIIMDCDPGGDDVVAMFWLLALGQKKLCNVRAVTTTEGNVKAPLTFAAADKVLTLLSSAVSDVDVCAQTPSAARHGDRDARVVARQAYAEAVARGAEGSGDGFSDASHIHGCDGMGGLSQRLASGATGYAEAEESYERLIRELEQQPGQITILATGPLTNLADAERARPGVLRKARRIVVMGGAMPGTQGNITPLAEFNFAFDSAAASLVMHESNLEDILLMPLDVTTKLICTETMIVESLGSAAAATAMSQSHPPPPPQSSRQEEDGAAMFMYEPTARGAGDFLRDLSAFMFSTALQFKETNGVKGFLVHDASTILALFYPECLTFTRAQVSVAVTTVTDKQQQQQAHGGLDLNGMTFIDHRHCPKLAANAWIGTGIDEQAALSIMMQDLHELLAAMPATATTAQAEAEAAGDSVTTAATTKVAEEAVAAVGQLLEGAAPTA